MEGGRVPRDGPLGRLPLVEPVHTSAPAAMEPLRILASLTSREAAPSGTVCRSDFLAFFSSFEGSSLLWLIGCVCCP